MSNITELPIEGAIQAPNFPPESFASTAIPYPSMQYKLRIDDVLYKKLDTAAGLYVVPILNNHFSYFVVMKADTSHDVKPSDFVRMEWIADDGSIKYRSEKVEIRCIEQPIRFLLPKDEVKKFEDVYAQIYFIRERVNEPDVLSAPKQLFVSSPFISEGNISVEGVKDGFLDAAAYPNGIKVTSQTLSNVAPGTRIIMQFRHPTVPLELNYAADSPTSPYTFSIDPRHYQGASGTPIIVQLSLLLSSQDFNFWYGLGAVKFKLK